MNRIQAAIDKMTKQIEHRISGGIVTSAQVETTRKSLDMDVEEHSMFQAIKSEAILQGIITLDEGQMIYVLLGESVATFNDQTAAVKSVLTGFLSELLKLRINTMQNS